MDATNTNSVCVVTIRSVEEEVHPTTGSKLNWDKEKTSIYIYRSDRVFFEKKYYTYLENKAQASGIHRDKQH
jgi:hypothetical protein